MNIFFRIFGIFAAASVLNAAAFYTYALYRTGEFSRPGAEILLYFGGVSFPLIFVVIYFWRVACVGSWNIWRKLEDDELHE